MKPVQRSVKSLDLPIIINAHLLLAIQIRTSSSGNDVNVFQWNWGDSSLGECRMFPIPCPPLLLLPEFSWLGSKEHIGEPNFWCCMNLPRLCVCQAQTALMRVSRTALVRVSPNTSTKPTTVGHDHAWTPSMDPKHGPQAWTPSMNPKMDPKCSGYVNVFQWNRE